MTCALACETDPEVKALLKQLVASIRVDTTQRDRDLQTVIELLAKYMVSRQALAFHYGAPPWPPEERPWS